MNRSGLEAGGCATVRQHMDSYVSHELTVEISGQVERHMEGCSACAGELKTRGRLRAAVKAAVAVQPVPPDLQVRIREHVQGRAAHARLVPAWGGWAAAVAGLVLGAGIWWTLSPEKLPSLSDRPAQRAYIQRVSAHVAAALRIGLCDHIHCSVFRKYPQNPAPAEQMEEALGPDYLGLLPVVRASVPSGYRMIMAHQCSYAGRRYVHMTLEKNGDLLSLVVTRRQPGESLESMTAVSRPNGVPIYQSAADRYQVAGFEAGGYLAYVISDLKGNQNLAIATSLAPPVQEFLRKARS